MNDAELILLYLLAAFLVAWILAYGPVLPWPDDDEEPEEDNDRDDSFRP